VVDACPRTCRRCQADDDVQCLKPGHSLVSRNARFGLSLLPSGELRLTGDDGIHWSSTNDERRTEAGKKLRMGNVVEPRLCIMPDGHLELQVRRERGGKLETSWTTRGSGSTTDDLTYDTASLAEFVTVGSSRNATKTVYCRNCHCPAAVTVPRCTTETAVCTAVDDDGWHQRGAQVFKLEQRGDELVVTRSDEDSGWHEAIRINCSRGNGAASPSLAHMLQISDRGELLLSATGMRPRSLVPVRGAIMSAEAELDGVRRVCGFDAMTYFPSNQSMVLRPNSCLQGVAQSIAPGSEMRLAYSLSHDQIFVRVTKPAQQGSQPVDIGEPLIPC